MNKVQPLVSVLMTAYQAENYIETSVKSILNQTYQNLELIVVEDGSGDATPSLLTELSKSDKRLRLFFPGRLGRAKALNFGLNHCHGKYLAINDADDFSDDSRIEKQVDFLEKHTNVGLLGTNKTVTEGERSWVTSVVTENAAIQKFFTKGQPIQHSSVMFRKDLVDQVGGYNQAISFLLDRDIFLRVAELTELHQLDEPLITLNRSDDQFFIHTFKGLERAKLSYHYQKKAIYQFKLSPLLVPVIWSKLLYSKMLSVLKNMSK